MTKKAESINSYQKENRWNNKFFEKQKNYTYQFKAMGLLFSSGIVNETRQIFLAKNGLAAAKTALINGKVHQVITVINLDEVKN